MAARDDGLARLLAAVDELARDQAAEVLADAQAWARDRVSSILADALTDSLLEHVRGQLAGRRDLATPPVQGRTPPGPTRTPPSPRESRPARPAGGELAWYVYGVVAAGRAPVLTGVTGIDPHQTVTTITEGSLAAIASRVPLEDFGETTLREHLADIAWIEATARAHDRVLDAVRKTTTVIPMRLCTVYKGEDALRNLLAREAGALRDALAHLAGKTEWGVKVFAQPVGRRPPAPLPRTEDLSGSAYMRNVRRGLEREKHEAQLIDQASAQIHERLTAAASEGVMLAVQRPEAAGNAGQMILNGAYLVRDEDQMPFHEEIQLQRSRFAYLGLEVTANGPWPAYNFLPGVIGVSW